MSEQSHAARREHLARILHDANTGSIVPNPDDPTRYAHMAEAVLAAESAEIQRLKRALEVEQGAYLVAFEGRDHAWHQLEDILDAFGVSTEEVDISAVAAYVRDQLAAFRREVAG